MSVSLGAAKLPMKHISIRVPWHDAAWDGTVCRRPDGNQWCTALRNIQNNKNDDAEELLAGERWDDLAPSTLPPCITERADFMALFDWTRYVTHAYARRGNPSHAHFKETPYQHAPYSAAAIPFGWMLRENAFTCAQNLHLPGFNPDREQRADELIGFTSNWVQVKENQQALLDTFFGAIEPEASLCFFYAKSTPLADDPRRVIVGVGRVAGIAPPVEYLYSGDGELRSMLWERNILHTIRPDMRDGFLLPYHALLDVWTDDPTLDLASFVAFAPDDAFENYSYVSAHVDHDQAISSLLNCAEALRRAATVVSGDWDVPLAWIDERLNELWRLRGPCPGLGSALTAYGIEQGTFLAYELSRDLGENEDPWPAVEQVFADPSVLGPEWRRRIGATLADMWTTLPAERKALLKLLSRFNVSAEQASRFYREHLRRAAGIDVSDTELLENPYLLYELDRSSPDPISLGTVDRGLFPETVVRDAHPLPPPSALDDAADPRRARAMMVNVLEADAARGDTVRSRDQIINAVGELNFRPECPLSHDLLRLVENHFGDVIVPTAMADGEPAYQLGWLFEMGQIIARQVTNRTRGKPHTINADWRALLDDELDQPVEPSDEAEERARTEKAAALSVLAESRFSVLIGPAGTGKTMLLNVLCSQEEIRAGGVLLLAPTGKARVQLQRRTRQTAQTIAQFLLRRVSSTPLRGFTVCQAVSLKPAGAPSSSTKHQC